MPYDITDPAAAHRLQLEGREKLTVAGVEDVERFDDQCIVLRTGAGVLVVSGESLHIGKLSLDGGELHVDGRIDALTYEDAPEARGGGCSAACSAEVGTVVSEQLRAYLTAAALARRPGPSMTCCGWCGCAAGGTGG